MTGWPVRTWVLGQTVFCDEDMQPSAPDSPVRPFQRGHYDETVRGAEAQFDHTRGGYWQTIDGSRPSN